MQKVSIDNINNQIDEVVDKYILCKQPNFRFRPNQKEAIVTTILSWLNGDSDVVISAPTGSGKSIIALIVAKVLSVYYGMSGYILASNLSLLDQYERDMRKYFPSWAIIKGQTNYICSENGLNFTVGQCKLKGCVSYKDIKSKFPCSAHCPYIIEREHAIKSSVLICTYAFWMQQQNVVKPMLGEDAPFLERDFTICDEAHGLVKLVQDKYSPQMHPNDIEKFTAITNAVDEDVDLLKDIDNVRSRIIAESDKNELYGLLDKYTKLLSSVYDKVDTIKRDIALKTDHNEKITKSDKILISNCDFVERHMTDFVDYVKVLKNAGVDNMVKNYRDDQPSIITFNCIDEAHLMKKYFHNNAKHKAYMSATIGNVDEFARNCAFQKQTSIDIPSTFNFDKSPIFLVDDYKMSYKYYSTNIQSLTELIETVMNMYPDKRGIIHTNSYKQVQDIMNHMEPTNRHRVLDFSNTNEQKEQLELFMSNYGHDKFLIGPTLSEGLSFDDDLCRVQIIAKVPYPDYTDKFVREKKDQPNGYIWYNNNAIIKILQSVGRGIRNEKDWCVTFIFDGCFMDLLNNAGYLFPEDFVKRIQHIPAMAIKF